MNTNNLDNLVKVRDLITEARQDIAKAQQIIDDALLQIQCSARCLTHFECNVRKH